MINKKYFELSTGQNKEGYTYEDEIAVKSRQYKIGEACGNHELYLNISRIPHYQEVL